MTNPLSSTVDYKQDLGWQLKILMLSWEYPPNVVGGLSRHVYELSVHLAEMGHEVHIITAGNGDLPVFELVNGVKVHRVIPLNNQDSDFLTWIAGLNLAISFKGEQLAAQTKFDLIHAHDWLVGSSAIILKQILGIPLLATIHATEHGRNNGIHNKIQQFIHEKEVQLIDQADQLIVCSEYMRDHMLNIFHVSAEKIMVIPNGIRKMEKHVQYQDIFPFLQNKNFIFSIGRIVKEKGFETIIDAATLAKDTGREINFVIAGKGPMLERYRKLVSELNLDHHVAFIGYVTEEQKYTLIQNCQAAVFPSLYEPFGIVALEAMIVGKPTIVSDTGGLKGIVKHLQTGLLMTPGDAKSLLDNIEFLLKKPGQAKVLGIKGSNLVKSLYGWKRIAVQTVQVMEDTILLEKAKETL